MFRSVVASLRKPSTFPSIPEPAPPLWRTASLVPLGVFFLLAATALQFGSPQATTLAVLAAWTLSWFALPGLQTIGRNRATLFLAIAFLGPLWFAGFDSIFHWDAVYSAVRAQRFWDQGILERPSLFYVALSPFVGLFPGTAIPSHLFVMLVGVAALLGVIACAIQIAGRAWGIRIGLIAAVLPPVFVLYRWVYLDAFLVCLWSWTLAASMAWSRNLTPRRILVLVVFVLCTSISKETGGLILFPVATALLVLAPRGHLRRRIVLVGILLTVALLSGGFLLWRYAGLRNVGNYFTGLHNSHQGLTFLPFNPSLPRPWTSYIFSIIRESGLLWTQVGLVVALPFAVVQPRKRWAGWLLVALGATAQLLWVLVSQPHTWGLVSTMYSPTRHLYEFAPLKLFSVVLVILWATRTIRIRLTPKFWILLMAIVPGLVLLLCFVKTDPGEGGHTYVWVVWRYHVVLLVGGLAIAARGLRNTSRWNLPRWLKGFASATLLLFILSSTLHGVGVAMRWRQIDNTRAQAYEWMHSRKERIVYTHWPYIYLPEDRTIADCGPLAWRRDRWDVRWIWDLPRDSQTPPEGAVFLWDVSRYFALPIEMLERIAPERRVFYATIQYPGIVSIPAEPELFPVSVVGFSPDTSPPQ